MDYGTLYSIIRPHLDILHYQELQVDASFIQTQSTTYNICLIDFTIFYNVHLVVILLQVNHFVTLLPYGLLINSSA